MKRTTTSLVFAAVLAKIAFAVPSSNSFHAVTNDWYNGNFSNVYELAQLRLASNSNDLVGTYLKVAYDIYYSDLQTLSNSMARVVELSDSILNPAFTNMYHVLRCDYVSYRDEIIPSVTDAERLVEQAKSRCPHKPIPGCSMLKIFWDNNLWGGQ